MLPLKHAREASRFGGNFELLLALCVGLLGLIACSSENRRGDVDERVVIIPREVEEIDPRFVGDAYGLKLSRLVYASLVTVDPFSLEPRLDLAERIDNEGPLRFLVRLRPNLRFSDGTTLDAYDVQATFRALLDARVNSRYRSSYARLKQVDALDARTVRFELNEPHATFVTDLEMPILRSEDAFAPRDKSRVFAGAGPFVLAQRSASALRLTPNRSYHRTPARQQLRFVVVRDDNVRALRMLAGAGDLAQNVLPPLLLPLFEARRDMRVRTRPGSGTTYIGFNLSHPGLSDVRVRAAIAHAIDRPQLIAHKLGGRARLASSWIPPGHWAHDPSTGTYAFNPERARQLLAVALGSAPRPRLVMRTSSDRAVVSLARAMASMLEEVGIDVEVRPSEGAMLLADLARGRFELTLMQVPELFEPNVLSWFFSSDRIPEPGVREGGNRFRLRSAALDRALETGRRELDRDKRIAAYHVAQQLLSLELPVVPLWHEDVVAVVSRRFEHYEVPSDARFGTLAR